MTKPPAVEQPRAFRLDGDAVQAPKASKVRVTFEAEPLDPSPPVSPPARKGWRWAGIFFSALASLAGITLLLWAQDAVINATRRSDVLGLAAVVLAGVIVIAALIISVRFAAQLMREKKVEKLKTDAASVLAERAPDRARAIAERLVKLQSERPETAAGRARFAAALPAMTDARDIIALAEREMIEPLDKLAADEIANAARQVATVTAVSPRALIDLVFVIFAGGRLITRVASIYGGRPGWLGFLRIARASLEHLLVTGGLAAGQTVVQQIIGQGLAARLSAKLGEGVLNGLMTARFGLAALTVCRPLPFVESKPPELTDVAAGLLKFGEKDGGKDTS